MCTTQPSFSPVPSRGWNNGIISHKSSIFDSFDICFLQEHWLIEANLHKIGDLSSDFSFVCVSGMDEYILLSCRPYKTCAILYRLSLLSCVTPVCSNSNHICAVRLNYDSLGSILLICV